MRKLLVASFTVVALAFFLTAATSDTSLATVLGSREAEQLTLANGATLMTSGNAVRMDANGERATWVDGGPADGDSVFVTAKNPGTGKSRACIELQINGVAQGATRCYTRTKRAYQVKSWTGLSLANADDLAFVGRGIGTKEKLLIDKVRVEGASPDPYPGVRYYQMVGLRVYGSENMSAQRVQDLYNKYMKPAYHGTTDDVDFVVQTHIRWDRVLVDENAVPTHAQMRDPNWSGYTWNDPSSNASEIDRMLQAPCVQSGKCKVSIHLSLGATSGANPPNFMLNQDLAWTGEDGLVRVKYYKPEAVQYAQEFTAAALERFNDSNIGSVKIGEYFPGDIHPQDYNRDAFIAGYEDYLNYVAANAPKDSNGDRVLIYQSNPITKPGLLEMSDFPRLKMGVAGSDPHMFEIKGTDRERLQYYGVIPFSLPGDATYVNNAVTVTWDGTPNPFNHPAGYTAVPTAAERAWYYGSSGKLSQDQEFILSIGIANEFQSALDRFGPGGTDRARWGGVPHPN